MKKIGIIITVVFMCFINTALAKDYALSQLDATVSLTDAWGGATEDVKEGDKVLGLFNMTVDDAKKALKDGGLHILAYNPETMMQLEISDSPASLGEDFNNVEDADLLLAFGEDKFTASQGLVCIPGSFSVFNNGQTKYVRYELKHAQISNLKIIQYYTEANGKGVLLSVRSYKNELTDQARQEADAVVKGFKFSKLKEAKKPAKVDVEKVESVPVSKIEKEQSEVKQTQAPKAVQTEKEAPAVSEEVKSESLPTPTAEAVPTQTDQIQEQTEKEESKSSNVLIYAVLASVLVVLIAVAIVLIIRKKNKK